MVGRRAAANVSTPLPERISSPAKATVEALTVVHPSAKALTIGVMCLIPSNGWLLAPKAGRDLPKPVKAARGRPEIIVKRSLRYLQSSSLALQYYSQLENGRADGSCEAESPGTDLVLFAQVSSMKVVSNPNILIVRSYAGKPSSDQTGVATNERELPVILLQLVRLLFSRAKTDCNK